MDSCAFENIIKSYLKVNRFLLPETPVLSTEDGKCWNQTNSEMFSTQRASLSL